MSRTPGASNLLDVRSTAVLQDYIITTNNCAPGVEAQLARRDKLGGTGLLENCQPPACGYDRPKDLLSVLGASIIVATVIGTIYTYVVFLPTATVQYFAGFIEYNFVCTTTYLILLLTTCIAHPIIEYAGHKLTALFGMIMMFVGILIDSQVFHISCLYVGNLFFVGVGGGLAYSASMTLPADLFRAKLKLALILISISASFGTIFYTWLFAYIVYTVGYKWAKLLQAILVLLFTLSVHVFPKTGLLYASGCDQGGEPDTVRDCVYKAAAAEIQKKETKAAKEETCDEDPPSQSRNLLCVCVCDLRLYGDKSFLLWACLVMVATMNFLLPYLTIHSYAESAGARESFWYITVYCLASMGGRCAFIVNENFTFTFNRIVFQGCILASGAMWIILNWATTFGWILVMCIGLGLIEGVLCVIISRVALGTIPRRWISGAWLTCIVCHGIGVFVMTTFTVVIAKRTLSYSVTYITAGIIQIIVGLLATLLPHEDEGVTDAAVAPAGSLLAKQYGNNRLNFSSYGGPRAPGNFDFPRLYNKGTAAAGLGYPNCGSSAYGTSIRYTSYAGSARAATTKHFQSDGLYKCECAICSKFGCLPGCLPDCTPAGSLDANN